MAEDWARAAMSGDEPIVQITFSFDDDTVSRKSIDCGVRKEPARYEPNEIAEDARESNVSFNYSGRHDHGPLPYLRADEYGDMLVSSLQEAKEACGEYLTSLISDSALRASGEKTTAATGNGQAEKRIRTN